MGCLSNDFLRIPDMNKYLPILLYLAVFVVACSSGMAGHDKPLVIGAVYNLHGLQGNLDIPSKRGAELLVAEVNRNGGLLGQSVKLAIVDGVSNPKVIVHKTEALLKRYPDMAALMGLSDTDMVLAAAPVAVLPAGDCF